MAKVFFSCSHADEQVSVALAPMQPRVFAHPAKKQFLGKCL